MNATTDARCDEGDVCTRRFVAPKKMKLFEQHLTPSRRSMEEPSCKTRGKNTRS